MAFKHVFSLGGSSAKGTEVGQLMVNSTTIQVGDFVGYSSGRVQRAGAGNDIIGLCIGFVTPKGHTLERAISGDDFNGTYTASTQTYAAASDNVTVDKIKCVIQIDPFGVYSGPADATIGTTTGSDLPGYYSDIIGNSDQVDENTALTTVGQLFHFGPDPDDSTQMLYVINENHIHLNSA